jgi:hypothetical protein
MEDDKTKHTPKVTSKKFLNVLFVSCMLALEAILLVVLIYVINQITQNDNSFFSSLSLCIIIIWIMILVGYLAWAVYFYNINLGLTNEDWKEIREKKLKGDVVSEPDRNPNSQETLGLPPGTVRGVIALSLLFGAMAMMVASLGFNSEIENNKFFVDNFEFFKTAFLMMIAFYFGEKSLKHFGNKDDKTQMEGNQEKEINTKSLWNAPEGDDDGSEEPNNK